MRNRSDPPACRAGSQAGGLHRAFRVARVVPEGKAGVTLILDACLPTKQGQAGVCQAGQFTMVWLPGLEERPFSVMNDDPLSLTIAEVGPFTRALCGLREGDRIWIRGPYGHGFQLLGHSHLLVGGGSGAASLTLLARVARDQGHGVVVALGARTAEQLMLAWRFEELGCQVLVATDDGSAGYHGTVIEAVSEGLADRAFDGVYACGPEPMLLAVARYAETLGLSCQVSLERAMKCGLGICGACHCGDQLVCRDGPVFSGEKLLQMKGVR